ncbi:MAG: outer membrane protein assembly factor BamB, partial [Candidatus Thiodiazotropha sp.]
MKHRALWPIPLLLLLTGCSLLSGKDNADPPAELVELQNSLKIETLWDDGFEGAEGAQLKLKPA